MNFPENIIMELDCQGKSGSLLYTMRQTYPCEMKLDSEITIRIESCG